MDNSPDKQRETLQHIRVLLATDDSAGLPAAVAGVHPADLAHLLAELPPESKVRLFRALPAKAAGEMLDEADERSQQQIVAQASDEQLVAALEGLPPDEAADVLASAEQEEADRLLDKMEPGSAREVEQLMAYPEDSAAGVMTTDVIKLDADMTVEEALQRTQDAGEGEGIRYPYVVDGGGTLMGIVPLYKLVFGRRNAPIRDIMETEVHRVTADTDREEAGNIVRRYDLHALPVVDEDNRLLGTVTADDAMEAMEEEASEDMYRIAGTTERDPLHGPLLTKVGLRLPWLIVTLFGGLLICGVVRSFQGSIQQAVVLASFLPLIPLMGGNVAIQASTIVVRGIALGKLEGANVLRLVLRELSVAVVLGGVCGMVVGVIARLGSGDPVLALVVSAAVFSAVVIAVLMGTVIPLLFHRIGVDPALAAGPFVTILNDLLSVTGYLGLATVMIKFLK